MARARGEPRPTRGAWWSAALTGSLLFVIGNGLVAYAEERVSSGLAAILMATVPLWAAIFSALVPRSGTRPGPREMAGLGLGLLGILVLNLGGDLGRWDSRAFAMVVAPAGFALGSVLSRRLPLPAGNLGAALPMLAGGAALLATGLAGGERIAGPPSTAALLGLAYLIVLGSLVGFTAFRHLLRTTRASVATSYAYVNPVVAVALGTMFGGEQPGALTLAGGALVLAAVLLITRR